MGLLNLSNVSCTTACYAAVCRGHCVKANEHSVLFLKAHAVPLCPWALHRELFWVLTSQGCY